MPRKALLCVLQLDVRSITCPGVLLKDKEELYLSVSVLGQSKKTHCVPAAFPLLFQEKIVFEKRQHLSLHAQLFMILPDLNMESEDRALCNHLKQGRILAFADIVDPGDLVELLELDTAVLELIQLVPPVGKVLATYEENTRDFLFPDPKLTRGQHGLDREILMKRSSSFTGIAPKLRFSTSSLITESLLSSGRSHIQEDLNWLHHSRPNGKLQTKLPKKSTLPPEKSRHSLATKNYQQPTIASKSRSPSPYTKRRMCELSEAARQRLSHLNLGPYEFRRETDKPPFVVRRVEQPSPSIKLHTWCPTRDSTVEAWTKIDHDPSLLGSYRPKKAKAKSTHGKDFVCHEDGITKPPNRQSCSAGSLDHSALPAFQKHSLNSVLNRSSLRERFSSGWPSPANGDEIHKRVRNILRTHSARQRLIFNESNSSKGGLTKTREPVNKAPLPMSELRSSSPVQQKATGHLANGGYWPGRAAVYKGKPRRAIFEESLEKIYRNMYQKASGTVTDQKTDS